MTTIQLTCSDSSCKTEFTRSIKQHNRSLKRNQVNTYCSRECLNSARSTSLNPNCLNCKEIFVTSDKRRKFCSHSCSATYSNKNRLVVFKPKPCAQFECENTVYSKSTRCTECLQKLQPRRNIFATTTLKELREKYSTSQYHAKIRGHARNLYKASNKPLQCVCGYTLHVDICHIKDVQDFNEMATISEVNHIDNLVSLCKRCHWEFDHGYLEVEAGTPESNRVW